MVVRPYLVMVLAVVACGGGGSTADAPRIPDAPFGFDATLDANVPPFAHVFA
jgi:hypothetical protein